MGNKLVINSSIDFRMSKDANFLKENDIYNIVKVEQH
jgi:hypothetical protein